MKEFFNLGLDDETASVRGIVLLFLGFLCVLCASSESHP